MEDEIVYREESYLIIGICMEIHRVLGIGFSEIIYKDALEYELKEQKISYEREKEFRIKYKDYVLPRSFNADFIVFDKIILEIKSCKCIADEHVKQTLNYLAVTKLKLGLIINFGKISLKGKRILL